MTGLFFMRNEFVMAITFDVRDGQTNCSVAFKATGLFLMRNEFVMAITFDVRDGQTNCSVAFKTTESFCLQKFSAKLVACHLT